VHHKRAELSMVAVFREDMMELFFVDRVQAVFCSHLNEVVPLDNVLRDIFNGILKIEPVFVPEKRLVYTILKANAVH